MWWVSLALARTDRLVVGSEVLGSHAAFRSIHVGMAAGIRMAYHSTGLTGFGVHCEAPDGHDGRRVLLSVVTY